MTLATVIYFSPRRIYYCLFLAFDFVICFIFILFYFLFLFFLKIKKSMWSFTIIIISHFLHPTQFWNIQSLGKKWY